MSNAVEILEILQNANNPLIVILASLFFVFLGLTGYRKFFRTEYRIEYINTAQHKLNEQLQKEVERLNKRVKELEQEIKRLKYEHSRHNSK